MYSAAVLAASTAACVAPAFYLLRGLHPPSDSVLHAACHVDEAHHHLI